ncbi:MAG: efflux RND transporter permease subunit [Nitrospirae bacterium]|nr:efflux RND transporter permease subunit [Nitrospirota bacterium]
MWLADTSIKRPVFATMVISAIVIFGIISYPDIGVDLFPKVDFPIININTVLKGASPEIMDVDVTDRIEEAVNTINGVKSISSSSIEGVSTVTVEFQLERDIDLAVQDVREKVAAARNKLPADILEPVIEKVDPDAVPVLWTVLTSKTRSVREISTYVDEVLKEQIQRIQGVGSIRLAGLQLRQARIWLDARKMEARRITAQDVMRALARENAELPGGRIESGTKEYAIKIKGEFQSIQDFNDLVLGYENGVPVRLRDVGRAEDGMEEKRSIARFNGANGVGMGMQKQSGTNTVEVVERVKRELENIKKTLPAGMELGISFDQSTFIRRSISEVQHHLIYGGFFAAFAVLLFLKSVRITLISALAIPTSIVATFAVMKMFNFTFNNMSMLALSLSVGILIDDAIIVIENIHRHIEEGMSPREAASFATSEIGLAVMATTLAIVAIFLPVAFMKGIIGRFFVQFALTVVFAVLISLLISFTLTPMMASRLLRAKHDTGAIHKFFEPVSNRLERNYKKLENFYRRILVFALSNRLIVLIAAVLVFVGSMSITKYLGKEFVPPEDQSRFIVRLQAPVDYSVDAVDRAFRQAEDYIRSLPEVKTVFYAQGFGSSREANKGSMFIGLKPKSERSKSQEQMKAQVRKYLRQIPGIRASAEDVSMVGGGMRNVPIQYVIRGRDLPTLQEHTRQIVGEFTKLPGIVDVDTSLEAGKPELKVYIDRDKAADLGVDIATIAESINFLVGGEVDVTKFKDEARGRRYDVRARLNPADRQNPDDLGRLYVRSKDGRLIALSNIVTVREGGGPSVINRTDRQRSIMIFANLEGKPLGQATGELTAIADKTLPSDYSGVFKGMAETMGESFKYLIYAIVLGIVLAYMILAAQFESFLHPVTVLLSMPFSFIGAFGALYLAGMTLNIFSFIGLILLMGLVKKNAILLVDYTNTLRERGMSRREAILQAGPVRLRPILMTTFAMVLGMMPIALGLGEGSETRAPMAVATVGGLITSLFLTLLVVPVAYDVFDAAKRRIRMLGRRA